MAALLLGSCLLLLVAQSLSLCVVEEGTDSACTNSSLLLVARSQIKENNGYSMIVNQLPNITTNCTTTNNLKNLDAYIGQAELKVEFLDTENTTAKITVPGDIGSGQHSISLLYSTKDPNCCKVEAKLDHEITLRVIDDPSVHHESTDPNILQCKFHLNISDIWTEFALNNVALGYCGQFTSQVEHKNDVSIYYDDVCTLKINKFKESNEGNYSCSVIVPNPDGIGFRKFNSISIHLNHDNTVNTLEIGFGIGVPLLVIIFITILCCIFRKKIKDHCAKIIRCYSGERLNSD